MIVEGGVEPTVGGWKWEVRAERHRRCKSASSVRRWEARVRVDCDFPSFLGELVEKRFSNGGPHVRTFKSYLRIQTRQTEKKYTFPFLSLVFSQIKRVKSDY